MRRKRHRPNAKTGDNDLDASSDPKRSFSDAPGTFVQSGDTEEVDDKSELIEIVKKVEAKIKNMEESGKFWNVQHRDSTHRQPHPSCSQMPGISNVEPGTSSGANIETAVNPFLLALTQQEKILRKKAELAKAKRLEQMKPRLQRYELRSEFREAKNYCQDSLLEKELFQSEVKSPETVKPTLPQQQEPMHHEHKSRGITGRCVSRKSADQMVIDKDVSVILTRSRYELRSDTKVSITDFDLPPPPITVDPDPTPKHTRQRYGLRSGDIDPSIITSIKIEPKDEPPDIISSEDSVAPLIAESTSSEDETSSEISESGSEISAIHSSFGESFNESAYPCEVDSNVEDIPSDQEISLPRWQPDPRPKILIVGDVGCGKKSLLASFIDSNYLNIKPFNLIQEASVPIIDCPMPVLLYIIAAESKYKKVREILYPGTDAVILCYSINDSASLSNAIVKWYQEIKDYIPNVPILLVANKIDLKTDPTPQESKKKRKMLSSQAGKDAAVGLGKLPYMECSAKTRRGVAAVFQKATLDAVKFKARRFSNRRIRPKNIHLDDRLSPHFRCITSPLAKPKLLIVGDANCGKKGLIYSFLGKGYTGYSKEYTVEFAELPIDDHSVEFSIYCMATNKKYENVRTIVYPQTDAVLLCFAADSAISLKNVIDKWHPEVMEHLNVPVFLVALRMDLAEDLDVLSLAQSLASSIGAQDYLECSAKVGEGVKRVFEVSLAAALKYKNQQKMPSLNIEHKNK